MTGASRSVTPIAAMLVIGDEILSGRTQDANAHHLAGVMGELGIRLSEIRVIPDERARIVSAVNELRAAVDYLFTSGGIGPTHDDITADCVAEAFGATIGVRDDAREILQGHYGGEELNAARLRMARIPEGAALIDNPVSRAPGFRLGNVFVLAGVPVIFREMLAWLRDQLIGGPPLLTHVFRAPVREGDLADSLGEIAGRFPSASIGVYPFFRGGLGATIVIRSIERETLQTAAEEVRALIQAHGGGAELLETPPEPG